MITQPDSPMIQVWPWYMWRPGNKGSSGCQRPATASPHLCCQCQDQLIKAPEVLHLFSTSWGPRVVLLSCIYWVIQFTTLQRITTTMPNTVLLPMIQRKIKCDLCLWKLPSGNTHSQCFWWLVTTEVCIRCCWNPEEGVLMLAWGDWGRNLSVTLEW